MKAGSTRVPLWSLLPLLGIAIACQDSSTGLPLLGDADFEPGYSLLGAETALTLQVEADEFVAGGEVRLVLENQSGQDVGYNLCFHAMERRVEGAWVMADDLPARICTTVLLVIQDGATRHYDTAIPTSIPQGEYRFRVALHLLEDRVARDQVSNAFHIGGLMLLSGTDPH